ncbi:hypothetical protein D3C85_1639100 [compost metagenome]
MRQAHERQQGAEADAAEHAEQQQLEGHQHAVDEAGHGREDCAEIHHLPPTDIRPGTATFFSTARMSSIRPMFSTK